MNGSEFLATVAEIVGEDNASRYASKIGDLDEAAFTNGILGYEALAFYVYTTSMAWHAPDGVPFRGQGCGGAG